MTFVVTEACIRCKYMDCVTVCPVDCFREGETMLVIEPEECIDCAACWHVCPAFAIRADSEEGAGEWLEHNRRFARLWPEVSRKADQTPADADAYKAETGKFEKYFSPLAGPGTR